MTHNITTEACGHNMRGQAVLTVVDNATGGTRSRTGNIRFQHTPVNSLPRVVIETSGCQFVVEGEDLYALRALLDELPESAFVEPAPAVEEPTWVDGDRITFDSPNVYVVFKRDKEGWTRTSIGKFSGDHYGPTRLTDDAIEKRLSGDRRHLFTVNVKGGEVQ